MINLWRKFYNDFMDRVTYAGQAKRLIEDHKQLCIRYVESMKRLNDGQRECDEHWRWASDRRAWLAMECLKKAVPDKVERDALHDWAWKEFIYRNDKRCEICKDKPEDAECGICLRNKEQPPPVDMKDIDKLIVASEKLLQAYKEKIAT